MPESTNTDSQISPRSRTGIARLIAATRYSIAGIAAAFKSEEAFRLELLGFLILAPLAVWMGETNIEIVLLVCALLLVLIVELLNTAIEALVDRFGEGYHELSRIAKDTGSAAVGISLLLVIFTWGMLLF
ncbi:MAG: diacylglycerol kinase [Pseudomonadales bacterium]|nr:diacylglycerol kinase [Pseudomonadales bacterium]